MAAGGEAPAPRRGIAWLASYPKSGNTWLRLFLAAFRNEGHPVVPNAMPPELMLADTDEAHYRAVSISDIHTLGTVDVLHLRGAVLQRMLVGNRVRPLFVKTHSARILLDDVRLHPIPYTGRSVYVVRDPRDVACSFQPWLGQPMDATIRWMETSNVLLRNDGCSALFAYPMSWSQNVESWSDHPDTLVVRYEDLLAKPSATFMRVVAHLGLTESQELVDRAIDATDFDRLQAAEDRERFRETPTHVDRFFRQGGAGGWCNVLTDAQAAQIEAAHGKTMQQWGYLK